MALNINVDGINKNVKPEITNNEKYLTSAKSIISSIAIPNDYYYYSQLKSIPNKISNTITKSKNLNKWISEVSQNITNAERKNENLINQMVKSMPTINLANGIGTAVGMIGASVISSTNASSVVATINKDNIISNTINYVIGGQWALDTVDQVKNTATTVVQDVKSAVNWLIDLGAKFGENVKSDVTKCIDNANSLIQQIGSEISDECNHFWEDVINPVWQGIQNINNWAYNNITLPIWDTIQSVGASVTNVVMGLIKGIAQVVEGLIDAVSILGTAIASIFTYIADGVHYAFTGEWKGTTEWMWQNTMSFVAEDHVQNVWNDIYKNTEFGKWLDEHAYDICKSDGTVTNIATGIGKTLAILATGNAAPIVAAVSAFGSSTQEEWAKSRDASWEGVERLYQKGEITEEQYNSYIMIRSLDDEKWAEIENEYKNGLVDEESFQMMKQVREMPEEWRTFENGIKGVVIGVANAGWEGIQYYVGAKLAGIQGVSKVAKTGINVAGDSVFEALDTPFRATLDATGALISGEDFKYAWVQSWDERGGWEAVGKDAVVGAARSFLMEKWGHNVTDKWVSLTGKIRSKITDKWTSSISKILNNSNLFDELDDATAGKIKQALLDDYIKGKIKKKNLSGDALEEQIKRKMTEDISLLLSCVKYKSITDTADFLYKFTDIAYNKTSFRKFQTEYFREKTMNVDYKRAIFIAEKEAQLLEKLIEKRGGYVEVAKFGNISIKTIKDIDWEQASVDFSTITKWINNLPLKLRKGINEINISDLYNPHDAYWAVTDGCPGFESAMTGGGGEINIFTSNDYFSFVHESGHCFDGPGFSISKSQLWLDSMQADQLRNGGSIGVTDYANQAFTHRGNGIEDFAESIKLFVKDEIDFKILYPNRWKILHNYLK